ncbi:MAG: glycosyltransferase family 39 protein [Phycisphaerae bacterium]|nr:glycosyltransferase family 39 protein [Phycisphaerae bacterium]MCZ2400406.1 glycosyltransferase family 39 protein [Phycisphaerae bacterium]
MSHDHGAATQLPSPQGELSLPAALAVVLLYAAAIYLPFLGGGSRTLTRHEVLISHPALQVLENGDWLIPHYTGRPWVDKPPLITWVTAGLFALTGGCNEVAARLPAALSAVALCVLIAALTARFYGNRAGLLAGLVQASCVYMYMQGRLGEIDMPFAVLVAGAHAPLLWHWGKGEQRLSALGAWTFHVMVGLAVLAKGPLGAILPVATVLCFCVFQRALWPLRAALLTPALFASVAIGLSWHVAVVTRLGWFGFERLWYTYFARAAGLHHLGSQNPLLYFYTIPWLVLPWSIVLLAGARTLARDAWPRSAWRERVLWAWLLGGLVVLTLTAFKHKHYCIPILPPLSILCGRLLAEHVERLGRVAQRLQFVAFAVALAAFTAVSGWTMPARDHRRETVAFVRDAVAAVPSGEPLYLVGLAQSAVYVYVPRPCAYADTPEELARAAERADGPVWVLTTRANVDAGAAAGLAMDVARVEPPRRKLPEGEALVLGRLRIASREDAATEERRDGGT